MPVNAGVIDAAFITVSKPVRRFTVPDQINNLVKKITELEDDLENLFEAKRKEIAYRF